ncbi:MAG: hypothetical protein Q7L55_10160 [Actinomycetota bacterium]|nr:hypothetical protein [Actinomycetota bacterium]
MKRTQKLAAAITVMTAIPLVGLALAMPANAAPADLLEAVGVPATGLCTDVVAPAANLAGVANGSWSKSWGVWISPTLGGPVCVRTLWYNNSTQLWDRR